MPIGRRRGDTPLYPLGSLQITGITTASAVSLANSIPPGSSEAWIQSEVGNVRWRADGVDPTPTSGMIMIGQDVVAAPTSPIDYLKLADCVDAIKALKFIAISVTSKIDVQFYQRA